jgi:hypothetical protein
VRRITLATVAALGLTTGAHAQFTIPNDPFTRNGPFTNRLYTDPNMYTIQRGQLPGQGTITGPSTNCTYQRDYLGRTVVRC